MVQAKDAWLEGVIGALWEKKVVCGYETREGAEDSLRELCALSIFLIFICCIGGLLSLARG